VPADPVPADPVPDQWALVVRLARSITRLSQREYAVVAGVSKSRLGRVESGARDDPPVSLLNQLLAPVGWRICAVDLSSRAINLPPRVDDSYFDGAGRRLPAHLEQYRPTHYGRWWGWERIAWWPDDPAVPARSFVRRRRYPR